MGKLRRGSARLIDSYAEGLIDKAEFEPRLSRLRERLQHLEEQRQCLLEASAVEEELRLILGRMELFAAKVREGRHHADFQTRRDSIRTLVKRVEVDAQQIRVVFRVSPTFLPPASDGAPHSWQHCGGRVLVAGLQSARGGTDHHVGQSPARQSSAWPQDRREG
jgi:site-specific DNA recombinase